VLDRRIAVTSLRLQWKDYLQATYASHWPRINLFPEVNVEYELDLFYRINDVHALTKTMLLARADWDHWQSSTVLKHPAFHPGTSRTEPTQSIITLEGIYATIMFGRDFAFQQSQLSRGHDVVKDIQLLSPCNDFNSSSPSREQVLALGAIHSSST
jgi:hypothetical protein